MSKEKQILTESEISHTLKRLASQIIEANKDLESLVFIGILTRGAVMANRLAHLIKQAEQKEIPVGSIDVALYRDDLSKRGKYITVRKSDIPFSIDDKVVVLVDDVIFKGRTIRAAMDGLKDYGRSGRIELAVLVDRGHRELPIQPDFVGKKVPSARKEKVQVHFLETDGADEVTIS